MATTKVSKRECVFMKIPLEIRLMIYRPLLISRYTMKEHDMNSKEFNNNRREILNGHDQTYEFDMAILCANRKIHEEAKDLCRRENNFVCLTSRRFSFFGLELQYVGLQLIAKGPKAYGFWNASMTLTLDFPRSVDFPGGSCFDQTTLEYMRAPEDGKPWNYIICSSQLPKFCRLLLEKNLGELGQTTLHVEIDTTFQTGQATKTESTSCDLSRLDELLDPLRQLHSFEVVHIQGPLGDGDKDELIASICKDCPTSEAVIQLSMLSLDRADDQVCKGHFTKANLLYKAALNSIRSRRMRFRQRPKVMADGPFPGLTASEAISNIVVRLHARIASVYFQTGQLRMARIYTERALDPRRAFDHRHNKQDYIETEEWEGTVYAEVLHVAASISYANNNIGKALYDLSQASECAPFDEEQESQQEIWQSQLNERRAKNEKREEQRKEANSIYSRKENEKIEGLLMILCNQKDRGDRLLQSGRSDLAASTYSSALQKLSSFREYWLGEVKPRLRRLSRSTLKARNDLDFLITSGPFKGLRARYATIVLKFKVQASMAAASSRSGRYMEVISLAEVALDWENVGRDCAYCSNNNGRHSKDCRYESEDRDWAENQRSDYAKIYYHRALALEKLGDTSKAIEDMEQALKHDPENEMALAGLSRLQRKLEEKVAHDSHIAETKYIRRVQRENKRELKARALQQEKARKINILQDRLRKKQIRRRGSA